MSEWRRCRRRRESARPCVKPADDCRRTLTKLVLVMGIAGCGSGESPPERAEADSAPMIEQTFPVPAPPVSVDGAVSAEERAAEEAFLTMTSTGISQEELETAIDRLLAIGAPAVPVLAAGLRADEAIRREMAATLLASMGRDASEATDDLIAALDDDSAFVRANAATALAQMEGRAAHVLPVFAEFLGGADKNLRTMMATNLGVLDAADAQPLVGQLTTLLQFDDRDVRLAVVEFLGRMGADAQAAVDQIRALDTTDDTELEAAVTAALLQIVGDDE